MEQVGPQKTDYRKVYWGWGVVVIEIRLEKKSFTKIGQK
jgi:hypothetical protein